MIMLNSRERREFELVYQTAKNYPLLKIENIFLESSRER